jgi:hypothetical protein
LRLGINEEKMESENHDMDTGNSFKEGKYSQKEYQIQKYEEDTIETVKANLENGFYDDKEIVLDHARILGEILDKFQAIYQAEERAGLANYPLKERINELGWLCQTLAKLIETVPRLRFLRSSQPKV